MPSAAEREQIITNLREELAIADEALGEVMSSLAAFRAALSLLAEPDKPPEPPPPPPVPPLATVTFDFGPPGAPVAEGCVPVHPSTIYGPPHGFGWLPPAKVEARDRGGDEPIKRDFCFSEDATFAWNVPDGNYDLTVAVGDAEFGQARMVWYAQGELVEILVVPPGEYTTSAAHRVRVAGGRLEVRIQGDNGPQSIARVNALSVFGPGLVAPKPPDPKPDAIGPPGGTGRDEARGPDSAKRKAEVDAFAGEVESRATGQATQSGNWSDPGTWTMRRLEDAPLGVTRADDVLVEKVRAGAPGGEPSASIPYQARGATVTDDGAYPEGEGGP